MSLIYLYWFLLFTPTPKQPVELFKVGFYNVENLFDAVDDSLTFDEDFTPQGRLRWTESHVQKKIEQIAFVVAEINQSPGGPLILLGLAEVENRTLLEQLVNDPQIRHLNYHILHYDSKDHRGIDVALLYRPQYFRVENHQNYPLKLMDVQKQLPYHSRDQLLVSGYFKNEYWHVLVNHWPSRRGGQRASNPLREKAAYLQRNILDSVQTKHPRTRILSMGDFNDNPSDSSLKMLISPANEDSNYHPLKNAMTPLEQMGQGSLAYRDQWFLFDQILYSPESFSQTFGGSFWYQALIFNPHWLRTPQGKYQNYPYRMDTSGMELQGFSDHFPVLLLGAIEVD